MYRSSSWATAALHLTVKHCRLWLRKKRHATKQSGSQEPMHPRRWEGLHQQTEKWQREEDNTRICHMIASQTGAVLLNPWGMFVDYLIPTQSQARTVTRVRLARLEPTSSFYKQPNAPNRNWEYEPVIIGAQIRAYFLTVAYLSSHNEIQPRLCGVTNSEYTDATMVKWTRETGLFWNALFTILLWTLEKFM